MLLQSSAWTHAPLHVVCNSAYVEHVVIESLLLTPCVMRSRARTVALHKINWRHHVRDARWRIADGFFVATTTWSCRERIRFVFAAA